MEKPDGRDLVPPLLPWERSPKMATQPDQWLWLGLEKAEKPRCGWSIGSGQRGTPSNSGKWEQGTLLSLGFLRDLGPVFFSLWQWRIKIPWEHTPGGGSQADSEMSHRTKS